ncbi:ABC transporter ATP-binding protein [Devriesea agamarum]|uniref:ABC transporter ATP-binding protein n=1 Tax=Devriesea agamarum TaxID=472569 RepID=UPI0018D3EBCD|nr:ABC transporter ATP-binding protein [Devriesea agamarum]
MIIKRKTILSHLDLQVEEGTFHGIIGPNGAGKTTLFNAIQGFREPTEGSIKVLGQSPYPRNISLLAKVGIQPQRSAFFPRVTLREHLSAVAAIHCTDLGRVDNLIEVLDLVKVADTKVEGLSGGERQRLAVATAIVHRPLVLFLDEPTAGLDAKARSALVGLLQSTDLLDMTTLYTTHYLDEAERLCDTVSIVEEGRILTTSSPSRLIVEANLGSTVILPNALYQADAIAAILGRDSLRVTRDGVEVRSHDIAALFAILSENGIDTRQAQVHDGRLEDVYLQLTGKDYVE